LTLTSSIVASSSTCKWGPGKKEKKGELPQDFRARLEERSYQLAADVSGEDGAVLGLGNPVAEFLPQVFPEYVPLFQNGGGAERLGRKPLEEEEV